MINSAWHWLHFAIQKWVKCEVVENFKRNPTLHIICVLVWYQTQGVRCRRAAVLIVLEKMQTMGAI